MESLWNIDNLRIRTEWSLKLDDFKIQIEAWYTVEVQGIIDANQTRINIETMRIIVRLEAVADERRQREEARIWGEVNILIVNVQGTADRWLLDETARINGEISISITLIINDGQNRINAAMIEWTLKIE